MKDSIAPTSRERSVGKLLTVPFSMCCDPRLLASADYSWSQGAVEANRDGGASSVSVNGVFDL
ncbi:MAG: hypothetical protein O3A00_27410, partial [Planctomycetota bacterium]|nr:hypothetical protein [Planctomycetota bacterium]